MKKVFALCALMVGLLVPAFAQRNGRQLSPDDQHRFDSYYSRWQGYQSSHNEEQIRSMEKRMQDVYHHYGIPADTPYRDVASGGAWNRERDEDRGRGHEHGWDRDRDRDEDRYRDEDRDWDQNRRGEWDRYRDRDRDYWRQNQHLSSDDQRRFDSYFQRWQNYRRTNNGEQIASMEKRMYDVYDHYGIPHDVPFDRVASLGR